MIKYAKDLFFNNQKIKIVLRRLGRTEFLIVLAFDKNASFHSESKDRFSDLLKKVKRSNKKKSKILKTNRS